MAIFLLAIIPFVIAGKGKPACNDGIDNDNDGLIDMKDPGCINPGDKSEYNEPINQTTTTITSTTITTTTFITTTTIGNFSLS